MAGADCRSHSLDTWLISDRVSDAGEFGREFCSSTVIGTIAGLSAPSRKVVNTSSGGVEPSPELAIKHKSERGQRQ